MNNKTIYNSAIFSLITQAVIGIICIYGLFINVNPKEEILKSVLYMETIVQIIEFIFYVWLVYNISQINYDITFIRYFDWFITTPTMLLSFMIVMKYFNSPNVITFNNFINDNFNNIFYVLLFNAIMLIFGFLGEIKLLSRNISFIFGFIFFFLSFYLMFINFVGNNTTNLIIFLTNFLIWSIYGIAYMFNYNTKNITYNILDIFSKNINGLFLFLFLLFLSK